MMENLLLSVRRCLRTVYFPVLLLVFIFVMAMVPRLGRETSYPPAGFCDLDGSAGTERIAAYLTEQGFVRCHDEASLREEIAAGKLDCGFVFGAGFDDLLSENLLDDAVVMISTPTSYAPDLYRNHVAAAVFTEVTPVISSTFFPEGSGLAEELEAEYRGIMDAGLLFSFRVETANTSEPSAEMRAMSYIKGTAALFVFALLMYAVCDILRKDASPLVHRIGAKKTMMYLVAPDLLVRVMGICLAFALSLLIAGEWMLWELFLPFVVYTILAASFAMLAGAVLAEDGRIRIFTFFVLLGALAMCPVLVDAALFLPWLSYVRVLCPPYWLWLCCDEPLMVIAALAAMPLCALALMGRIKKM